MVQKMHLTQRIFPAYMKMRVCKNPAVIFSAEFSVLICIAWFVDHQHRKAQTLKLLHQTVICGNASVITAKPHTQHTNVISAFRTVFHCLVHTGILQHLKKTVSLGMHVHFFPETIFLCCLKRKLSDKSGILHSILKKLFSPIIVYKHKRCPQFTVQLFIICS